MYDIIMVDQGEWNFDANWEQLLSQAPMAKRISYTDRDCLGAIQAAAKVAKTKYFFYVPGDLNVWVDEGFDFSFEHPETDPEMTYHWDALEDDVLFDGVYPYKGVKLFPRKAFLDIPPHQSYFSDFSTIDGIEKIKSITPMVKQIKETSGYTSGFPDIFFLSYDEPHADDSFAKLQKRFPRAKHIHGIKGIHLAHQEAAHQSLTKFFYVVDADCEPDDDFSFSWMPPENDPSMVTVWFARNAANGLTYGYGGIKLFPREEVLDQAWREPQIDFTRSVTEHFRLIPETVCTTHINLEPFQAWRSGFREAAKLSWRLQENPFDGVCAQRLHGWTTGHLLGPDHMSDNPLDGYVRDGAQHGAAWAQLNIEISDKINDYDWLNGQFQSYLYERF